MLPGNRECVQAIAFLHGSRSTLHGPRLFGLLLPILIAGVVVALALGGLRWLDGRIRDDLGNSGQYQIAFHDIQCEPPAALSREDFLAEVQYLSNTPTQLNPLDASLAKSLFEAFVLHPWVDEVQRIEVLPDRQVRVQLRHRVPVLAVKVGKDIRAVDRKGVRLPTSASVEGLILFVGEAKTPKGPEGTLWGDDRLTAAAAVVDFLGEDQTRLRLKHVQVGPPGLILLTSGGSRIIWGQAPGAETSIEAKAEEKRRRLLQYCDEHGDLDHPEPRDHDVRE